ncbi:acyl-CoA dehydrogenase family protein [Subtercola lobariae]|uniref:Acyl-CoA dehydrogenase n=1 Tax=Subtercola lobariae TaxID=1588641 RepID=A0A917EYV1_9MICO|nr:acyl-CoA dehydrogenase family protein [Subtercola lobariae]GGF35200.1 acyl-CoA dehydrogenase [Subtercola lobariae]
MSHATVPVKTQHTFLSSVEALAPVIKASSADLERAVIPEDLVQAFEDAGIFDAWLPAELTGSDFDPVDWLRAIEEISYINGSAGWLAFIVGSNVRMLSWTPEQTRRFREIVGGRLSFAINGVPRGRAIPVEGGYRVSGRWSFSSSSPFSTWHGGASLVMGEHGPVATPDGGVKMILATWPATNSTLYPTWDGLGLRGTGSDDIEVTDLFVPADHVREEFLAVTTDAPAYRVRSLAVLCHGVHALGVAQSALDEFAHLVSSKPWVAPVNSAAPVSAPMGHSQSHRIAFAKADALVRAARALLYSAVDAALVAVENTEKTPLEHDVALRQANIFAVRSSREAIELIFQLAGTSALYKGTLLERAFRDIATASNHFQVVESQYESVGSYLLTKDSDGGPFLAGTPFI